MKPLTISSKAVGIRVSEFALAIDDYENRRRDVYPAHELPFDMLVFSNSNTNLSSAAIKFLMKHSVPVVFLDWEGKAFAHVLPAGPINGELQVAQLKAFMDPATRRQVAEAFLAEKYSKTLQLLGHLHQYYPDVDLGPSQREVRTPAPSRSNSFQGTLMSKEARVARMYFTELVKVVNRLAPDLGFRARGQSSTSNNMSASDPFNVALNVAYGVLECWVRSSINASGLNENLGFLHEAQPGATPLVYDFMECVRWLADYSLVQLLEKGAMGRKDFYTTRDFRMRMKDEAVRSVVDQLSVNLRQKVPDGHQLPRYETLLGDNARTLVRYLLGESSRLDFSVPFAVDVSPIDAQLRQRILSLTPVERTKLGIKKVAYHYIRKRAMSGKPLRLYRKVRTKLTPLDADLAHSD